MLLLNLRRSRRSLKACTFTSFTWNHWTGRACVTPRFEGTKLSKSSEDTDGALWSGTTCAGQTDGMPVFCKLAEIFSETSRAVSSSRKLAIWRHSLNILAIFAPLTSFKPLASILSLDFRPAFRALSGDLGNALWPWNGRGQQKRVFFPSANHLPQLATPLKTSTS